MKKIANNISVNANKVLEKRYLKKDAQGNVIETPDDMFQRVAINVAQAEKLYNPQVNWEPIAEQFYSIMANLEFLPNSPTLMNAGRELQQLSACFVIPIGDSMESIFEAIKNTAMIHKSGGGTGFSFSRLRPKNSQVRSTGGVASGPVSFLKVFDAATQAVKQGGCVAPETRVSTAKGLRKIKNLGPANAPADSWHKYNPHPVVVVTDNGLHISDEFYNHGLSSVRTIKTKNGYKITGTEQHRLRVIDQEGNYVWRHIKEIKAGDWVVLQKDTFIDNKDYQLPKFTKKAHFNAIKVNIPSGVSKELGEFIGAFVGDGAVTRNKRRTGRLVFSFSDQDKQLKNYILKIAKALFGLRPAVQKKQGDASTNYFFNSTTLVDWLQFIGVDKPSSLTVRVPEVAFSSTREFAQGFLRGLFSTDGTVSQDGYPSLSSVSLGLIEDVQQLLLALGIPTKIRKTTNRKNAFGKNPLYHLRIITLAGIRRFAEEIGFIGGCKNRRLKNIKPKAWEFNDIIPKISSNQTIQRFLRNEQFYDRVMCIEEGRSLTLDLSVPANNTYIANGFVSHNTRRGANMGILRVDHPDILEFISCKENDKDITNFNISVAVTEDFMQRVKDNQEYDLIDPHTKKITGRLNAREVFSKIVQMAWKNGEPGIIFLDRMNKYNPTPALGEYESTNPCVTGDTFIATEHGLMKVKEIIEKYGNSKLRIFIDSRTVDSKKIHGGTALLVPAKAFCTGKKQILRLHTKAGYELKLTPNHSVCTERGWLQAKDLIVGEDKILIQSGRGSFSYEQKLPFSVIKEYRGGNGRIYKSNLPTTWSEELGTVLGWLVGDGNLHGSQESVFFYFGKDDKAVLKEIMSILKHMYGKDGTLVDRGWEWQLNFNSKLLFHFFEQLGVKRARANEKVVPASIFTAPREAVKGFLKGLFSSDGTVNYVEGKSAYVRLSSASLKLLKDVQLLLLNFGIFSRIYMNRKERMRGLFRYRTIDGKEKIYETQAYHELEISRQDVIDFIREIGFIGDKHKAKIDKLIKKAERKRGYYRRERSDIVTELKPSGIEEVFDLTEPISHSFVANGCIVHNCGEQVLLPLESCNLGSINLSKIADGGKIDWDKLSRITEIAVRFLDNVIDMNKYPLPKIEEMTKGNRKIGLGVMGFADLLIKLGIPYNSEEALSWARKIMNFILERATQASQKLAEQRGSFPNFKNSIYSTNGDRPLRNATLTTIAPTGTLSIIANCSSGIEPIFAVSYLRKVLDKEGLVELHPLFEQIALERGFFNEELMQRIGKGASIQEIEEIPADVRRIFVTAHEISPEWHIRMQAAFQEFTNNAVSKTANCPHDATVEDVEKVYKLAHELGCKGVTIYRDRSREEQVLNIGQKQQEAKPEDLTISISPRPRPQVVTGTTTKITTGCGNLYITINEDEQGQPFEVFMQIGKAGGCAASQLEAIGRLVSLALRSGVDLKSIIDQLRGIRCPSPSWSKDGRIFSCADAIARVIEIRIGKKEDNPAKNPEPEQPSNPRPKIDNYTGEIKLTSTVGVCPDCGSVLRHEEGCVVCGSCGYTRC